MFSVKNICLFFYLERFLSSSWPLNRPAAIKCHSNVISQTVQVTTQVFVCSCILKHLYGRLEVMVCRILFMSEISETAHHKLLSCMEMPFSVIIVIKEVRDWDGDCWKLRYIRISGNLLQQWNTRETAVGWWLLGVNYMRAASCFLGAAT